MSDIITLAHGSGGKLTHGLIKDLFHKHLNNGLLMEAGDSAVFGVEKGRMAFTTDSYVISPIFFRGGDIGKLAVCGTVNDLAVCGANPRYLSCGFIIEEGFKISDLEAVVQSMAQAANEAGVYIVTGDTKIVQKGCADKLFINTSGVGIVPDGVSLSTQKIRPGDKVIISGTMGDHGTAILLERENFSVKSNIVSDCAPLNSMIKTVMTDYSQYIRIMRDPTRGGVATTLNELAAGNQFGIRLFEDRLPVKDEVKGICEMLGMDPLYMANEGKVITIVDGSQAERVVNTIREHPYGKDAAIIGEVDDVFKGKVHINTIAGGNRIIDMLVGDQLPRIC
ncbi:MAG: hydrogenase expression/formation protein HypE [Bacillota bacterium]